MCHLMRRTAALLTTASSRRQYTKADQRVNQRPLWTKIVNGKDTHFLYRSSRDGCWSMSCKEESVAKNMREIKTKSASELPTQEGVVWQYYDGKTWQDDDAMACTEVLTGALLT